MSSRSGLKADGLDPVRGPQSRRQLGDQLRQMFTQIAAEPLPQAIEDLIEKLEVGRGALSRPLWRGDRRC